VEILEELVTMTNEELAIIAEGLLLGGCAVCKHVVDIGFIRKLNVCGLTYRNTPEVVEAKVCEKFEIND
jgi:hypothetical protein